MQRQEMKRKRKPRSKVRKMRTMRIETRLSKHEIYERQENACDLWDGF